MLRHNFAAALRQLWRNRAATLLNLIGLAIGLGCFVFADGTASDLSGRGAAAAYRNVFLMVERQTGGASAPDNPGTSVLLAPALRAELPAGYRVARMMAPFMGKTAVRADNTKLFMQVSYADADLPRMFALPGASPDALAEPFSLVLSKAAATRLFGAGPAIGRTLAINGIDATVTAVIVPPPAPSPFRSMTGDFDILASWDIFEKTNAGLVNPSNPNNWFDFYASTYVAPPPGGGQSAADLDARLAGFGDRHIPKSSNSAIFLATPGYSMLSTGANMAVRTDITGIPASTILDVLGIMILATAAANYINLATAQVLARAREVRIRRIIGATATDLLRQHAIETSVIIAGACILLALLAALLLPLAGVLLGGNLRVIAADRLFWLHLGLAVLLTAFIAGIYPALLFASLPATGPVQGRRSYSWVRSALTGLQFASAAILLIFVLVANQQNRALKQAGFSSGSDPVVAIESNPGSSMGSFRAALRAIPEVRSVGAAQYTPWGAGESWDQVRRDLPGAQPITNTIVAVNEDYFPTMGIKLLAGRELSPLHGGDGPPPADGSIATHVINVMIDRELAGNLGWQNPADAIGQPLYMPDTGPMRIVGVTESRPTSVVVFGSRGGLYWLDPGLSRVTLVRIDGAHISAALAQIDAAWDAAAPLAPEKREFIDDIFASAYQYFTGFTLIVSTLVALALLVALAGLAGMALEVARSRQREVAIRKMVGASTWDAARLLLWQFARPLLIANLVAWPLAFAVTQGYRSLFTVHAPASFWPFLAALCGTLAIAGLTVAGETWRTARLSPAEVLRAE